MDPDISGDQKLIGVDGVWYDVTSFLQRHPGGNIMNMFLGEDATSVFKSIHGPRALSYVPRRGTYTIKESEEHQKVSKEIRNLGEEFKRKGYFETNNKFYVKTLALTTLFFLISWTCVLGSNNLLIHAIGAVFLFLFWQQCGFMMHDLQHSQMFRTSRYANRVAGSFFGTVCLGVHSMWWFEEHNVHHALTNVVDAGTNFADPQMHETIWAQNSKLFPFFSGMVQYILIKIQHITFIPVVIIFGRIGILVDSYKMSMIPREKISVLLHWSWMLWMLSYLPTWSSVLLFYTICSMLQGSFHFQLILSHYCKPFHELQDIRHTSWHVSQIVSNVNIDIPPWMDWYFGGLNFHIEHHLFPKMARHKLREASIQLQHVCKKLNLEYDSQGFFKVLFDTVKNLKLVGSQYQLSLM